MSKQLTMVNGEVRDAPAVCHGCQQPGDLERYGDGEWYHPECKPE
jgi:hypothetical protein